MATRHGGGRSADSSSEDTITVAGQSRSRAVSAGVPRGALPELASQTEGSKKSAHQAHTRICSYVGFVQQSAFSRNRPSLRFPETSTSNGDPNHLGLIYIDRPPWCRLWRRACPAQCDSGALLITSHVQLPRPVSSRPAVPSRPVPCDLGQACRPALELRGHRSRSLTPAPVDTSAAGASVHQVHDTRYASVGPRSASITETDQNESGEPNLNSQQKRAPTSRFNAAKINCRSTFSMTGYQVGP